MNDNNELREELKDFKGKKVVVLGKVTRTSSRHGSDFILLKNVLVNFKTSVDHVWIRAESRIKKANIQVGEMFKAVAKVGTYPSMSGQTKHNVSSFRHIQKLTKGV